MTREGDAPTGNDLRRDAARGREEAARRLLEAWRGEVEAAALYELIAQRQTDPQRAEILRRIAAAEVGHRHRLEERMRALGVAVPDPATVKLSPWQRLQARVAPIERLLAAREAAEIDEIDDRYVRPTGDEETDRLLHGIRAEERSHSMAVEEFLAGSGPPQNEGRAGGPRSRLELILGRERWHQRGSGWISGAIYGANDGLAAVFGIVTGVSGATGESHFVLTAGLAGAIASALSMAVGALLAERSEIEVAAASLEQERREIAVHPEEEVEELALFYQLKGLDAASAQELAERQAADPDALLQALASEELGHARVERGNPALTALSAGVSTGVGAMVPVLPFFFMAGAGALVAAGIVSLVAHFAVGAAKSLFTLRGWWSSGLEMTIAGVVVGGATYAIGLFLG